MTPLRLLLLADDPRLAQAARLALHGDDRLHVRRLGHTDADGHDAVLVAWDPVALPALVQACQALRAARLPVIALGAQTAREQAAALAAGADVCHPRALSLPLLRAQILAHQRVADPAPLASGRPPWATADRVQVGALHVDWRARRASVHGEPLGLTPRQFEVLAYFAHRAGDLVSRDDVLDHVWGLDFDPGTNVVNVHVHHVRRHLAAHGLPACFETVRGRGYRFAVPHLRAQPRNAAA